MLYLLVLGISPWSAHPQLPARFELQHSQQLSDCNLISWQKYIFLVAYLLSIKARPKQPGKLSHIKASITKVNATGPLKAPRNKWAQASLFTQHW